MITLPPDQDLEVRLANQVEELISVSENLQRDLDRAQATIALLQRELAAERALHEQQSL